MSLVDRGSRQRSVCGHKCAVMMGLRCATEKQITKHKSKWVQAGNKLIYRAGEVSAQLIFFLYVVYRFFFPFVLFCYNPDILLIEKSARDCSVLWGCAAHLCLQWALLLRHCCWAARLPSRCSAWDQPQVSAASSGPTDSWLREKESNRERERERKSVNSVGIWEEKGSQKKKSLRTLQRRLCTAALR